MPSSVVPSKKLTVPVGVPEPGAVTDTVAVSVTGAPSTAGLGLAARTVRVSSNASRTETVSELTFATARSDRPSPLTSPMATEYGLSPVAKSVFVPNPPAPLPSNTDTVLEPRFATARSGRPSPLTSPIAIEFGMDPVAKSVFTPNPPAPFPSSTDTVLAP